MDSMHTSKRDSKVVVWYGKRISDAEQTLWPPRTILILPSMPVVTGETAVK